MDDLNFGWERKPIREQVDDFDFYPINYVTFKAYGYKLWKRRNKKMYLPSKSKPRDNNDWYEINDYEGITFYYDIDNEIAMVEVDGTRYNELL